MKPLLLYMALRFTIRADLYDSLGGLDERFFLYEEDIDLCYRVHCLGFAIVKLPEIVVVHYGGRRAADYSDISPEQQHLSTFVQRLQSQRVRTQTFHPLGRQMAACRICDHWVGFLVVQFSQPKQANQNPSADDRSKLSKDWHQRIIMILVIAGMHRSGTSLFASWLQDCGMVIQHEFFIAPYPDNPNGFFEDRDFVRVEDVQSIRRRAPLSSGNCCHLIR